jgi:hypothetical protein
MLMSIVAESSTMRIVLAIGEGGLRVGDAGKNVVSEVASGGECALKPGTEAVILRP